MTFEFSTYKNGQLISTQLIECGNKSDSLIKARQMRQMGETIKTRKVNNTNPRGLKKTIGICVSEENYKFLMLQENRSKLINDILNLYRNENKQNIIID